MSLTKEQLLNMDEATLQKEVLIPLFKNMKFQDVQLHQGTTEFGKDIVMWEEGTFGERINHAVVVKAKKITGSASGNSGAGTVASQIQQCFGKNYLDHVTTEEQRINHVYVVNSQQISKEAIEAIKSIINNQNIDRSTTFIDGDKLWEFIEKYMSERTVFHRLNEVMKICDEVDPYYRVVPVISDKTISLTIQPKDPNIAKDHPLSITTNFDFPDTPEGQAKREEYNQFLRTGSEMTIPKEYIKQIDVPDFMNKFLNPNSEPNLQIKAGSLPTSNDVFIFMIKIECEDGEEICLDYIPLVKIQGGSEEITLTNEGQKVPWKFRLTDSFKEHQAKLHFHMNYAGFNVKRVVEGFRFANALAKGGVFRVLDWQSGFQIWHEEFQPGLIPTPHPKWLYLYEKILFIQEKVHVPIVIPENMTDEIAKVVFETAYKLEYGRITPDSMTLSGDKEGAKELLNVYKRTQPFYLGAEQANEVIEILGASIPLGPSTTTIHNGFLSEDAISIIENSIETATTEDIIHITFNSSEDRPITTEYSNWLPQNESPITSNQELRKSRKSHKPSNPRKSKRRR